MKIKFNANQEHQIQAINAIVDLFEGQPKNQVAPLYKSLTEGGIAAVPNVLDLDDKALLRNLQAVQEQNFTDRNGELTRQLDEGLHRLSEKTETAEGEKEVSYLNFSVEMETGTGKTYVYIRTALELFKRYGFRKFIIVVPSVAIREGVLKTFEMTRSHFRKLFDNPPYRFREYDSSNLNQVRQFALSDAVDFLVMTLASFNKADTNVIFRSTDRLQGETPIYLLQAARPILILDEPQNMGSEKSGSSTIKCEGQAHLRMSAFIALERLPRRLGGVQRGGGSR